MNEFDRKWQAFAARARLISEGDTSVPPGFAAGVIARWGPAENASLPNLWLQLGLRSLAAAAVMLVICALMEFHAIKPPCVFAPHVEDTVAQVFWML